MKLLNAISYCFLGVILFFCALFVAIFGRVSLAESPGIKIIEPADGSTVVPGQEVTVVVESMGGFVLKEVLVVTPFSVNTLTSSPFIVNLVIPNEAVGAISISGSGKSALNEFVEDEITLKVEQTATLQSLQIDQDEISVYLDWDGNVKKDSPTCGVTTVYGIYSDGITRILSDDPNTTYTSSDPRVVSIDNKGNCEVRKVGQASITVSNSGVSKVIPIVFEEPTSIRPSETIPPTTTIDIQPPSNSTGWHNIDITITLIAHDNERGSGVKEIEYTLVGMRGISSRHETIEGDREKIFISQEGIAKLGYYARDNERNVESAHLIDLNLDKTPPIVTATTLSQSNSSGWHNSDVSVTFTATDKLSGVKSVTPPLTISNEGVNQIINGEAIDIADNKATTSVNLNLDKTPPYLMLQLKPITLSEQHRKDKDKKKEDKKEAEEGDNWQQLFYSATDTLSGLTTLKAGIRIIPLNGYQIESKQNKELNIKIDEKKKALKIEAPNPQEILNQLQNGLLSLNNNQILQLKLKQGEPEWKIKQKEKGIEIQTPSIIFEAEAIDLADNKATKELEFKEKKRKEDKR